MGNSDSSGIVYKLNDGTYNDDSAAIDSYVWTKDFSGKPGEENFQKDFRSINMLLDTPGNYNMGLRVRVDGREDDDTSHLIDLNPGGRLFDEALFGQDFGGSTEQDEQTQFFGRSGKRIQFKFHNQNTADQRFKIHGINYQYNIKGYR